MWISLRDRKWQDYTLLSPWLMFNNSWIYDTSYHNSGETIATRVAPRHAVNKLFAALPKISLSPRLASIDTYDTPLTNFYDLATQQRQALARNLLYKFLPGSPMIYTTHPLHLPHPLRVYNQLPVRHTGQRQFCTYSKVVCVHHVG